MRREPESSTILPAALLIGALACYMIGAGYKLDSPMKLSLLIAAVVLAQASFAADKLCLKSGNIDQIRMTGIDTAVATDRAHHSFDIVFIAACSARHPNVHFVLKPELMPSCVGPGTALPTNREGPCVAKKVTPRT